MKLSHAVLLLAIPILAEADPAPNNGWWNATPINLNNGLIQGSTVGSLDFTGGYGYPTMCSPREDYAFGFAGAGPDLWYRVTVPQTVPVHIFACQTSFNVMVGIWDLSLNLLSANDDWCGPHGGAQTCCILQPGEYYVSVDGSGPADAGTFNLQVNVSECGSEVQDPFVDATEEPVTFALQPAVPNPFNPETVLRVQLPETAMASLKVYDLAGHQVAVLMDGLAEAGTRELRFQGDKLPAGVYFAVLQAGGVQDTQKLLLVK
jgi:hypothetical protein